MASSVPPRELALTVVRSVDRRAALKRDAALRGRASLGSRAAVQPRSMVVETRVDLSTATGF
jgi:hypothetical protein